MGEWVIGTTIGDLKGLSRGCIPPFPTKNQRVLCAEAKAQEPAEDRWPLYLLPGSMNSNTQTHAHAHKHTYIYSIHTYLHTYIHTYIH